MWHLITLWDTAVLDEWSLTLCSHLRANLSPEMWVAPTLKIDILAQSPHCQALETPTVRPQPQHGATGFSHPLEKSQLEVNVHSMWNLLLRCPQTHSKQRARRRARKKEANQGQVLTPRRPEDANARRSVGLRWSPWPLRGPEVGIRAPSPNTGTADGKRK